MGFGDADVDRAIGYFAITEQAKSACDHNELDQLLAGSVARQNWLAPSVTVIDVSDSTHAGAPGTADAGFLS